MSRGIDLSIFLNMIGDLAKPMKDAEDKVKKSTDRMKKSMTLSLKLGGAGLVATGIKAMTTSIISDFTASTREIQRASGDLHALGMENVQAVIAEGQRLQSTYVGLSTEAFTRAAYDIKSGVSSLTDEGVAAMTSSALTVAKATKGIPENMTSLFATSYGIFKKQFAEMSDADWGDMFGAALSASVQRFKTDGAKMQQAIESAGAGATNLGMKMTEQMTLLGMMQQQMSGSEAGTALKAFANKAAEADEKFAKLATTGKTPIRIRTIDENGQLRSMPDLLADLREAYGPTLEAGERLQIQQALGSEEAVKLVDALYGQEAAVRANVDALEDAAAKGREFTEGMAASVDDYDGAEWDRFIQQLDVMKQKVGAGLLPAMDKLVPILSGAATAVGNFAAEHPGLVAGLGGAIVGLAGLATVAAPVLYTASTLVTTFSALRHGALLMGIALRGSGTSAGLLAGGIGKLKGAFNILKVALLGIGRALMANPLGLAITAIAGGAYLIYRNWEPIKAFFQRLWSSVKSFASTAWEGIKSIFLNYTPHGLIIQHWDKLPQLFCDLWGKVKTGVSTAWDGIKAAFMNYTPAGLIYKHWDDIAGWFGKLWDGVKTTFTEKWESIKSALTISDWFDFEWGDVLPNWDWGAIIPDLPDIKGMFSDAGKSIDVRLENRTSNMTGRQWQEGAELVEQYRAGLLSLAEVKAELESKAASGGAFFDGFEVNRAQDMLAVLQEIEATDTAMPQIDSPETLAEAAQVAETLTQQYPALSAAAQEAQTAVTASISAMIADLKSADFASEGQRLMQSLANGIRSQIATVTAAARAIADAIRSALPKSATMKMSVAGAGAPVQARARGGSFNPGWLLTGEEGPELQYASEGGYIAHNRALQGMVGMAERARNLVHGIGTQGALKGGMASIGMGAMASAAAAAPMGGMEAFGQLAGQIGGKVVTVHQSPVYHIDISNAGEDMEYRLRAVLEEHDREMTLEQERLLND